MVLVGREVVLLAVDRPARRGEDDLAHAAAAGRLGEVQAPQDVDVGVEDRILDGTADVHLRGVVDEDLRPGVSHQVRGLLGADVEHVQLRALRHVLPLASRQVVDDQHPVPCREIGVGDVGADESGPSGDADDSFRSIVVHGAVVHGVID